MGDVRRSLVRFASVAAALPFLHGAAAAQDATGFVQGAIADEIDGRLPGVTVTVRNSATGLSRTAVSDDTGSYAVTRLPEGVYDVSAYLPGFVAPPVTATVGAAGTTVDFTMTIAPLAETVNVTRTDQNMSSVPNAVTVQIGSGLDFTERKASLDEALRGIPGLLVQNRRDYGLTSGLALSIRAPPSQPRFGVRGVALVQDGIPVTAPDGTTEPGSVDLGSVSRIEIIRGPSSVLYGNSAGGVVNLVTEIDPTRRLTIRPNFQVGSYGYARQQIRVDGHNDHGTRFMGSFSRFVTEGWRSHSEAEIQQTNVVVRQTVSTRTELSAVFNHYHAPFTANPSYLTAAEADDPRLSAADRGGMAPDPRKARPIRGTDVDVENWGETTRHTQGGVTIERTTAGKQFFAATVWTARRHVDGGLGIRAIGLNRSATGIRSEYRGAAELGTATIEWTAGIDVASQDDDRTYHRFLPPYVLGGSEHRGGLLLDQLEGVLSTAPFAQVSIAPHTRVTVTAGVRHDYYRFTAADRKLDDGDQSGRRTMSATSPTVGLTFALTPDVNVYGNYSTAYTTPTTIELARSPIGVGGFNQDLGPEWLRSVEAGLRGLLQPLRLRYELAAYRSRLQGAIVPILRGMFGLYYRNVGETARNGVELSLSWTPTARFNARFAYTYQDFVYRDFLLDGIQYAGNHEPAAPPRHLFGAVDYVAPFGLKTSATLRWFDEYYVTNLNRGTATNWAHEVVDLRFGWIHQWRDVDLQPFFGIDNLFNERYNSTVLPNNFGGRYFRPSPGREFYVGMTVGGGIR